MAELDENTVVEPVEQLETEAKPQDKTETNVQVNFDVDAFRKQMVEELSKTIRKDEKDKLYPTIDKLKEELAAKEAALKKFEEEKENIRRESLTAEELMREQILKVQENYEKLQEDFQTLATGYESKLEAVRLETTKEKVLAKYGDEIIPELVTGNTVEELIENAEKAHARYVQLTESVRSQTQAKTTVGTGVTPQSKPSVGKVDMATIDSIKDPEEWAKVREKLLEQALQNPFA